MVHVMTEHDNNCKVYVHIKFSSRFKDLRSYCLAKHYVDETFAVNN